MSDELNKLENVIYELSFAKRENSYLKSKKELEKTIKIERSLNLLQKNIINDFLLKEKLNVNILFYDTVEHKKVKIYNQLKKIEEHIFDEQNILVRKFITEDQNNKNQKIKNQILEKEVEELKIINNKLNDKIDEYKYNIIEFEKKHHLIITEKQEKEKIHNNLKSDSDSLLILTSNLKEELKRKEVKIKNLSEKILVLENEKNKITKIKSAEDKIKKTYGLFSTNIVSDCKDIMNYIEKKTVPDNSNESKNRIIKSLFKALKTENKTLKKKIIQFKYHRRILNTKNKMVESMIYNKKDRFLEDFKTKASLLRFKENIAESYEDFLYTIYFNMDYVFRNGEIENDERFTNILKSTIEENLEKHLPEIVKITTLLDISKKYVDEIIYLKKLFKNIKIFI